MTLTPEEQDRRLTQALDVLPDDHPHAAIAAQGWLASRLHDGATCPCCGQYAQIYRRKLNRTMVEALRLLHDAQGRRSRLSQQSVKLDVDGFVHAQSVFRAAGSGNKFGGDVGKLALWDLVVERDTKRDDGGRAGWWKVTPDGAGFLSGLFTVPKYALVYNGERIGYDGEHVGIDDVAPTFRLDDLKAGR